MLTIICFLLCLLVPNPKITAQFWTNLSSDYLATHTFTHNDVEYILYEYRVTWEEARVICLSYTSELATVDTNLKAQVAIRAIANSNLPISENVWIGAREDFPDSWFWISSRSEVKNVPRRNANLYPISLHERLQCLSLDRIRHNAPAFVPLRCNQRRPFICQREKYGEKYNGKNIRIVDSTRIDKEEFVLYSARFTWPEAVVRCRKENLQIAEVKTTAQAQSLAFLMIRARPESIESAWIGGYATGNAWKWLPSGNIILNNDLWRNDNRVSSGCLLLDRHVCEVPVYLEAKCDLKRDVICQKPSKKRMSEKPISVYVEGCLYWIGFRALTWFQAQHSCKELNASLVVLDSSTIIKHMMFLMEDHREELQHIWTDGRRKSPRLTSNGTMLWRWAWESTGEAVPEIGASFVPWCSAGQCHDNSANCLNLDRASYDTPIVYGLHCNQSQTYVCQPRSKPCMSRRLNLDTSSNDENSSQTFLPTSLTTESYYDETVNRQFPNHSFPPNTTSQFDSLQRKNLNFKEEISSVNLSENNDDYGLRKSYTDKIEYVNVTGEGKEDDDIKSTTAFSVPFYGLTESIKMKVTPKDIENNIREELKLNSPLISNITHTINNDEIHDRERFILRLKVFPLKVFDGKNISYDKVKIPRIFRPLVYFPINRYYYNPRYHVRSDNQRNIFLYRSKGRNDYVKIPKK